MPESDIKTFAGIDGEWEMVESKDYDPLLDKFKVKYGRSWHNPEEVVRFFQDEWKVPTLWRDNNVWRQVNTPAWVKRERELQAKRKMPVWVNEPFWLNSVTVHRRHFIHVSTKDPKLLAYVSSDEKGERSIYTPIKPGRYLTQYFKDHLTPKRIAFLAAWQINGIPPEDSSFGPLQFATTPDEIADIYIRGPYSCMSGEHFSDPKTHPSIVYCAGDLAVAYFNGEDNKGKSRPLSRCLVWPEKKVAGRVYPTPSNWRTDNYDSASDAENIYNRMVSLLKAAGYQFANEGASFQGARIARIPHRNSTKTDPAFLMPYMDSRMCLTKGDGDTFIVDKDGRFRPSSTGGYARLRDFYVAMCSSCGEGIEREKDSHRVWTNYTSFDGACSPRNYCSACMEKNTYKCFGSGERYSTAAVRSHTFEGNLYCKAWFDANVHMSSFSGKRIPASYAVRMADDSWWHSSELREHGFTCIVTRKNYPKSQMHPDHNNIYSGINFDSAKETIAKLSKAHKDCLSYMWTNSYRSWGNRQKSATDLHLMDLVTRVSRYSADGYQLTESGIVVAYLLFVANNSTATAIDETKPCVQNKTAETPTVIYGHQPAETLPPPVDTPDGLTTRLQELLGTTYYNVDGSVYTENYQQEVIQNTEHLVDWTALERRVIGNGGINYSSATIADTLAQFFQYSVVAVAESPYVERVTAENTNPTSGPTGDGTIRDDTTGDNINE